MGWNGCGFSGDVAVVAIGGTHSMVLTQDGSVWAAGSNSDGEIGDGTTTSRATFVQVIPSGAKAISAGDTHSMVLMQDNSVWATGNNEAGALGAGSNKELKTFFRVIGASTALSNTRAKRLRALTA